MLGGIRKLQLCPITEAFWKLKIFSKFYDTFAIAPSEELASDTNIAAECSEKRVESRSLCALMNNRSLIYDDYFGFNSISLTQYFVKIFIK